MSSSSSGRVVALQLLQNLNQYLAQANLDPHLVQQVLEDATSYITTSKHVECKIYFLFFLH